MSDTSTPSTHVGELRPSPLLAEPSPPRWRPSQATSGSGGRRRAECLGGNDNVSEADLDLRYTTACGPRHNARQSLELALMVAELLQRLPRQAVGPIPAV